jgi:ferredoxin
MAKITFFKKNITVDVSDGTDLLTLYKQNSSLPFRFGCTQGKCGVCAIQIVEGQDNLSPPTREERHFLDQKARESGKRLACQCAIKGDIVLSI